MHETKKRSGYERIGRRAVGTFAMAAVIAAGLCMAAPVPAIAAEDHVEPLGSGYENVIVPKHRAIISFMDADYGLKTYRGQAANLETDLSKYYGSNVMTSTKSDLGVSGNDDSRVFSQTQAFGVVPQTRTIAGDFMGQSTFEKVPTGIICTSYLTKHDDDGDKTDFWLELTGRSESAGTVGRIGRVKVSGIKRPYFKYKFNADGSHVDAPALDRNVAHDMVAWDWDRDGYTDWLVNYITNPDGKDDHKNTKIALLFIDGKSLYNACRGSGSVKVWTGPWIEYTTGGDVVGGLTTKKPPNSNRMAIGDMDGDGNPEVGLYYTKVQGGGFGTDHDNGLKLLRLTYDGSGEPKWDFFYAKTSDVGQWHVQYDSVTAAMGDIDGDGFDEMAVFHGNASTSASSSTLYLDIYKIVNGEVKKVVKGKDVGTTAQLADKSTPAVEASIADLDGDGFGELIHIHTEADHATRLHINIHKWPVTGGAVVITDAGSRHGYYLTDKDSGWKMDDDHARFSIATGMFLYPDTEKLRKQIGLVSTLDGSSGKDGVRWGIFSWDESAGLKLIAKGTKADGQLDCNVVPTITAADLDDDSMVLGQPTGFTVYDNIEPIFIVQAPPRHWDTVASGDGQRTMDAFAVLNGYSTSVTGKTTDAQGTSTTKTSSGHWGASAGFSVSKVNVFKENAKMFDAGVKYAGEAVAKNTESKTVTTTTNLTATAQYDDQIYYRANTHDVWRYPVLSPESQAFVVSGDEKYRKFVQFIVPQVIESSFAPTSGKEVDWYEPRHNGLNLFSYPKKLEQTRDYPQGASTKPADDFWKDINGTVLAKSTGQVMGNVDSASYNFTIEVKEHQEELKSLKNTVSAYANLNLPAWGVAIKKVFSFGLTGDYTYGTDTITTSDRSKLGGITVSWPGVSSYVSPSGMTPGDQQFTVDAAIYTSDAGALSVAYAVANLYKKYSAIWGDTSPYNTTADPALNLPRQWVINAGKWQANPFPGDASRIRGLVFQEASIVEKSGVSGQALPINTQVHATMRVYNYSFVPTGKVTVTFAFQPIASTHEDPDVTKATTLGSTTILSIPGRDSGTSNNWQDLGIAFTTHATQTVGYLHISLTTDGGDLQANNDHGQLLVGVYDPEQQSFAASAADNEDGSRFLRTQANGRSLTIVPDSMSVRPLNPDGTFGAETTALAPGETAVVQATIRFTDAQGSAQSSLLNASAYLRNASGFVSHRTVPMLVNGEDAVVQMLYTAPDTAQTVPLRMIAASSVLPAADDENPSGRIATKVLVVGDPGGGSGGGCSTGPAPAAALLALPLALLFRKR